MSGVAAIYRTILATSMCAAILSIAACNSRPKEETDIRKVDMVAYRAEEVKYENCVFERALELNAGSSDVKLIVETAQSGCSLAAMQQVFESVNFNPEMTLLFIFHSRAVVRENATELLLRLRAAPTNQ